MTQFDFAFDGVHSTDRAALDAAPMRPAHRGTTGATMNDPACRADAAPFSPSFSVADHDRDHWRIYDGIGLSEITPETLLACDLHTDWLIIESCHLVPQGDFSVSAPFTLDHLHRLEANAASRGVQVRTIPNRRTPRAFTEFPTGDSWDMRDKTRDTEMWWRWLTANPRRLASCKRWTAQPAPVPPGRIELRAIVMRDVNMVRQWRQYPAKPPSREFARRGGRAMLAILRSYQHGQGFRELTARLGCPWKPQSRYSWDVLGSTLAADAYCLARDARTGEPRPGLSGRLIREICGLYANGYPTQIRSDLRHHGRMRGKPTNLDRDFVDLTRRLALGLDLHG